MQPRQSVNPLKEYDLTWWLQRAPDTAGPFVFMCPKTNKKKFQKQTAILPQTMAPIVFLAIVFLCCVKPPDVDA